jgi:hypothetical protein
MQRFNFTIQRYELKAGPTFWFESRIHYLIAGAFSGPYINVACEDPCTEKCFETRYNVYKAFVQTLEATNSMKFATVLDDYMRGWYQRKATEADPIYWLAICWFDVKRQTKWNSLADESIQIHRVRVSPNIGRARSLDWISLTYEGMTNVRWS